MAGFTIYLSILTLNVNGLSGFQSYVDKRDKEGHFTLIKGEIHQKEITIINLCVSNIIVPNFIKHTLKNLKACIDSNTVVVEDFNTPLSPIDIIQTTN
jgi:hypothetical protein